MNKKTYRTADKQTYQSQISRQLLVQYVLSLIAFSIGLVILILMAWSFFSSFIWQDTVVYRILRWFKDYIIFWTGLLMLIGWLLISYHFLSKPLRYLDELITASEQLAQPGEDPIVLPSSMKNIQDELNLVREQALRNAMAAKEAEQRKNDLIVYLAHDLKTPLTSVIGYLTLLRDEAEIPRKLQEKYTNIALEKALRLEDLINEFFEITRFNLSHLTLETAEINLSLMLEQIVSEFQPYVQEKGLQCQVEIPPKLELECDPDKLARVFDNLLRNACNYSFPEGTITVAARSTSEDITVTISNPGKNIPREKLERIFDQFFRLDSSRTSATGGSGLGLAIAKEIVQLHGGTIYARSSDNLISFHVVLPRHPVREDASVRNS